MGMGGFFKSHGNGGCKPPDDRGTEKKGNAMASKVQITPSNPQVWMGGLSLPPRRAVPTGIQNAQLQNFSFHREMSMSKQMEPPASRRTRKGSRGALTEHCTFVPFLGRAPQVGLYPTRGRDRPFVVSHIRDVLRRRVP